MTPDLAKKSPPTLFSDVISYNYEKSAIAKDHRQMGFTPCEIELLGKQTMNHDG